VTRENSEFFSSCAQRGKSISFSGLPLPPILGASVFIGGEAVIGDDVTLHPRAVILPGVKVGDGAFVGAGCAANCGNLS
jgi:UDP-3-O-[3-hydroxymyristoyl] glucosamine N-acyltransferase